MSSSVIEIINDDDDDDVTLIANDDESIKCIDISSGDETNVDTNKFSISFDRLANGIPHYDTFSEFRTNPLCMLIRYVMKDATMKKDVITKIDKNLLDQILRLFITKYNPEKMQQKKKAKLKLNYDIDVNCLIKFIQIWKGWKNYNFKNAIKKEAHNDLYCYLRDSFRYVQKYKEKFSMKEIDKYSHHQENILYLQCSLKQLKLAFNYEPLKLKKCYQMESNTNLVNYCVYDVPSNCLHNWPYISTQIEFDNFCMIHLNVNQDEYHLINLKNNLKLIVEKQNTKLYIQPSKKEVVFDVLHSVFIHKYLDQLKSVIEMSKEISRLKKSELIDTLIMFQEDLALCKGKIETNTHYYQNLNEYPYVRYLGFPSEGGISDDTYRLIKNQKAIGTTDINTRIMQKCYPRISFILEKFNVAYRQHKDNISFIFDDSVVKKLDTCLTYKCTLCDTSENLFANPYAVSVHLMEFHGVEVDWECMNCKKSFDTKNLSKCRWRHNCN